MQLARVLIVDDNDADQFISRYMFEAESPDTEILQAYDGQEALEVLAQADQAPDLIILDINMPRMNGYEFLAAYDALADAKKTSVVVMLTSSSREEDRNKALSYQCVIDYLCKPLDEDDIKSLKAR